MPENARDGLLPKSSEYYQALAAHAHVVAFVLRTARRAARVAIVTNSLSPWVLASGFRFLPGINIEDLLSELEIPVYYSRRHVPNIPVHYSQEQFSIELDRTGGRRIGIDIVPCRGGPLRVASIEEGGLIADWNARRPQVSVRPGDSIVEVNGQTHELKEECRRSLILNMRLVREVPDIDPFMEAKRIDIAECLDRFYGTSISSKRNVVSIGDSCAEQQALKNVLHAPNADTRCLCKTVNLLDAPTVEQLSSELRILMVWLSHIVDHGQEFDLAMDSLDDLERKLFQGKQAT